MRLIGILAITAISVSSLQAAPPQKAAKSPGRAAAQAALPAESTGVAQNAEQTRRQLDGILRDYPPSLRQVLQIDPSLLTNEDYLQLYPQLSQFLGEHPEVAHNPGFFVGQPEDSRPRQDSYQIGREIVQGLSIFFVFSAVVTGLVVVVRTIVNQSRWSRISKTQEDVHSKLMDRLTSNQDLLAYMQSPAGKHFLESAPISLDAGRAGLGSPIGRILVSVQAGVVLTFAGAGLQIGLRRLDSNPATEPLTVIATLAIAIGIGFIVSAGVAYAFSQKMGLIQEKNDAPTSDVH
jgi:hypothetical protein